MMTPYPAPGRKCVRRGAIPALYRVESGKTVCAEKCAPIPTPGRKAGTLRPNCGLGKFHDGKPALTATVGEVACKAGKPTPRKRKAAPFAQWTSKGGCVLYLERALLASEVVALLNRDKVRP